MLGFFFNRTAVIAGKFAAICVPRLLLKGHKSCPILNRGTLGLCYTLVTTGMLGSLASGEDGGHK